MATVIGIFEDQFKKKIPLTVVKPGSQSRRFTHVFDTIEACYYAWKKNKCRHYSVSHKKSYTITEVAKMFDVNTSLIRFWEKEFKQIAPKKTDSGKRKFTQKDIRIFERIYDLVKEKGFLPIHERKI